MKSGTLNGATIAAHLVGPDPEHSLDLAIRQLAEQHAVDDAEDGGRRANAQRDRDDGAGREGRGLAQRAQAVTDVAAQAGEDVAHSGHAIDLNTIVVIHGAATHVRGPWDDDRKPAVEHAAIEISELV